ncbi:MAG: purine-nucleoside phosphorylase [Leucobacter sp.]|nr:purine-nucleoside phosphorylase [Leucobacter sp.]
MPRTLLVFAHDDEASAFAKAGVPHLVTGVGKINATLALSRAILDLSRTDTAVGRVIVLGTAGAVSEQARLDTVYQVTAAVQHDFSLDSPRLELAGDVVAEGAVIATGDVFVQDDAQRAAIAAVGASLVDMESYAYAAACRQLGVPLQIFKTPSDFADSSTTQGEWDGIVGSKSAQLFAFAEDRLPHLLG